MFGSSDRLVNKDLTQAEEPIHKTHEIIHHWDGHANWARHLAIGVSLMVTQGGEGIERLFFKQGWLKGDTVQVD